MTKREDTSWLAELNSRNRTALALMFDGMSTLLAFKGATAISATTSISADPNLVVALILGALWIHLSIGLYRDREAYFGAGSRRRRVLGATLVLVYSFLINRLSAAPLSTDFLLAFSALLYLATLGSRLLARRLLA